MLGLSPTCLRAFSATSTLTEKLLDYFNSNGQISFPKFSRDQMNKRSQLYLAIKIYLSGLASAHARRLKADMSNKSKTLVLIMDDHEEVTDEFQGVKVRWISSKKENRRRSISLYNGSTPDETRFYKLVFHRNERGKFTTSYLRQVMEKAKEISAWNRQRKLYINNSGGNYGLWSHVIFKHPASFETLAMDPIEKRKIMMT